MSLVADYADRGFCLLPDLSSPSERERWLPRATVAPRRGGVRVWDDSHLRELAHGTYRDLASEFIASPARPVRILYFDKQPGGNWSVPYHQDLTIAVVRRSDVPGFGPWSEKEGVVHVQPPAAILGAMAAIRLHIDDCNADNGPLRVIVGSHREGKIPEALIAQRVRDGEEATLTCAAGGILIMSPLVLHASSPAQSATHRRVLHIEYAGIDLPHPLRWHLDSAPL